MITTMSSWERVKAWFSGAPAADEPPSTHQPRQMFAAESHPVLPVDQLLLYAASRNGRIDRARALTVPAVLRGRNLICSISTLPLQQVGPDNTVTRNPLLEQLDANVPNTVTMAQTVEDLLFEGVAWWRVVAVDAIGRPTFVRRYDPGTVSMNAPSDYTEGYLPSDLPSRPYGNVIWMAGEPVPFRRVIRFDSPNPGFLVAAGPTISRALTLDFAADMYATQRRMRGFFTPKEGADPADDDAISDMLNDWATAREERLDGYVPHALDYNQVQDPTPAELQIIMQQQRVDLQLANAMGIDPEDLGINTTSRTYQNAVDRRKDRINDVLSPYMQAITDRLTMPDVTPRGQRVRFFLDEYLRADPKTRAEVDQAYVAMGALGADEARAASLGLPPRPTLRPPARPTDAAVLAPRRVPSRTGEPMELEAAAGPPAATFDRAADLVFETDVDAQLAVDATGERRTVTGLIVPWGAVARSAGRRFRFRRGTVKWSSTNRVKLLRDHVNSSAVGRATRLWEDETGLWGTFKVARGAAGDDALALAADGVLDGLSFGIDFRDEDLVRAADDSTVVEPRQAAMREVSLTAVPAFDDSRLTSVRASRDGGTMNCEHCGAPLTPGVAHTCSTPPTNTPPAAPVLLSEQQFDALLARFGPAPGDTPPAGDDTPPEVDPTGGQGSAGDQGATFVAEPLPYRFSQAGGRYVFRSDAEHDFSTDLINALKKGQQGGDYSAELGRINGLISAAFANDNASAMFGGEARFDVDRANIAATTPNRYRPDMWMPQRDYVTPLWDMVNAGGTDGRKFDIPKFDSASGLVGPATEGVEPAPGAMAVTMQTIEPTQVWGKVEITRQAWRAGGTPQLSGILWDQMLREYYEDREQAVATFLNTLTAATDITLTGTPAATPDNDDDQVTIGDFSAALADLQYVRGGNRFRAFALHQALGRVFARVKDDAGRPLYPMINPSNANGTTAPLFRYYDIDGVRAVPAWALGTPSTAATNSWLFDPAVVLGWAGAPERLFWDFGATVQTANIPQLSHVTVGIYGDIAFGNTDIAGVRQVIFDPSV